MSRRSDVQGGQSGFMLLTTLGLLLFFSITVAALMGMTVATTRATQTRSESDNRLQNADSALDAVVAQRRMDVTAAGQPVTATVGNPCRGATVGNGLSAESAATPSYVQSFKSVRGVAQQVTVTCEAPVAATPSERQILLKAYVQTSGTSDRLYGMAQLVIEDSPDPGAKLVICDWQLGATADMTPAACP